MKRKNVIVGHKGINKNKVLISEEALENAVETAEDKAYPLLYNFNRKQVIGEMKNLRYEDGKVIADIEIYKEFKIPLKNRVVRLAYRSFKIQQLGELKILSDKTEITEGSVIESQFDSERELK